MKAFKASNLKVEAQRIEIRNLRLRLSAALRQLKQQPPQPKAKKGADRVAAVLRPHLGKIELHAKKFGTMNELFVPATAFMVPNPNYDILHVDRYKDPRSVLKGITAELFEEVPKSLHEFMEVHTDFRDTVGSFCC